MSITRIGPALERPARAHMRRALLRVATALTIAAWWLTAAGLAGAQQAATSRAQSAPAASPPIAGTTPADAPTTSAAPVELSTHFGVVARPLRGETITVAPGFGWKVVARVALTPWLGIGLEGGHETHAVHLERGAMGLSDRLQQPALAALRIGGLMSLRHALSRRWQLELGAGIAWLRVTVPPAKNDTNTLVVPQRNGVLLTLPLAPRAQYIVVPGRIALSAHGLFALTLPQQSGELFAHDSGSSQALRQDSGNLVLVGGYPRFAHSYAAFLSLDLLL